jgi:hypothetical protein
MSRLLIPSQGLNLPDWALQYTRCNDAPPVVQLCHQVHVHRKSSVIHRQHETSLSFYIALFLTEFCVSKLHDHIWQSPAIIMYSKLALVSLLAYSVIDIVHATLYVNTFPVECLAQPEAHLFAQVINPKPHSSCQASKPCTVQWLDDGLAPLLSDIGVCSVGLYTGREVRLHWS